MRRNVSLAGLTAAVALAQALGCADIRQAEEGYCEAYHAEPRKMEVACTDHDDCCGVRQEGAIRYDWQCGPLKVCQSPIGLTCRDIGMSCLGDRDCCSGQCDRGRCYVTFSGATEGNPCGDGSDCRGGLRCEDGSCRAPTPGTECRPAQESCQSDAECCSGQCYDLTCSDHTDFCATLGARCADQTDCCGGFRCQLGQCIGPETADGYTCLPAGTVCREDDRCCNSFEAACGEGHSCG
jgi:hypothetical protein